MKPEIKGKKPLGRYMHSLNHYRDSNVLIVYGGRNDSLNNIVLDDMHVLYLDSLTWCEVTYCGTKPRPRVNFNTFIQGSKLYILGGQSEGLKVARDYEIAELDQEVNFKNHISKYFLRMMGAFIKAKFQKPKPNS